MPDVCAEFAALASAAVRNRFVFDILAAYQGRRVISVPHKSKKLTPGFRLAQVGAYFPCAHADHAEALRPVKRADFLFCLAKRHTIRQFSELGLCVSFLGFASAKGIGWRVR